MMWWVLSSAWAISSDATTILFEEVLTAQRNRGQSSPTLQCPQESCTRIPLSGPNAMTNTLMVQTHWLEMMNRYSTHNPIIPSEGDSISGRFMHHQTQGKDLYFYMNTQKVQSLYWTWNFETLRPNTGAFDMQRQSIWNATIQQILENCETQSVLSRDDYGNRQVWQGQGCGAFDLWIESHPTDEQALRILGVRQ